jgi:hypothetical protein
MVTLGLLVAFNVDGFQSIDVSDGWTLFFSGAAFMVAGAALLSNQGKVIIVAGSIIALTGLLVLCGVSELNQLGSTWGWNFLFMGGGVALEGLIQENPTEAAPNMLRAARNQPTSAPVYTVSIQADGGQMVSAQVSEKNGCDRIYEIVGQQQQLVVATQRRNIEMEVTASRGLVQNDIHHRPFTQVKVSFFEGQQPHLLAYTCPTVAAYMKQAQLIHLAEVGAPSPALRRFDISFLQPGQDRYSIESWKPVIKKFFNELLICQKNYYPLINNNDYGISWDIVLKEEGGVYKIHYFIGECSVVRDVYSTETLAGRIREILPSMLKSLFILQLQHDTRMAQEQMDAQYRDLWSDLKDSAAILHDIAPEKFPAVEV